MRKFSKFVTVYKLTMKSAETQERYPNLVQTNHTPVSTIQFPSFVKDTPSFETWLQMAGFSPNSVYRLSRLQIKLHKGARFGPSAKFQIRDYQLLWVQPKSWLANLLRKGDKARAMSSRWAAQEYEISES